MDKLKALLAKIKTKRSTILKTLAGIGISIGLIGAGFGLNFVVRPSTDPETGEKKTVVEIQATIELAEEHVPAILETADGEVEVDLPTIAAVDSPNVTGLIECPDGETECGLGTYYYAPVDAPATFKDFVLGGCWDTDGAFGSQCWDLGDLFFQNYAGRRLSTCGTGAAKGTWDGDCKFTNAGNEFALVYNASEIQAGDWVVFNNGTWGHIGMALGAPKDGYVALLGQNQGSAPCPGGGSSANIINIALKNFAGAFRPKAYIVPEPAPTPEVLPDTSH